VYRRVRFGFDSVELLIIFLPKEKVAKRKGTPAESLGVRNRNVVAQVSPCRRRYLRHANASAGGRHP
ncbi:MAG: hypothetical protein IKN27_03310, partial [Selenomonadaceae bacterium]|nr:hypothetical protein [Selenomonadaceae bacterium]